MGKLSFRSHVVENLWFAASKNFIFLRFAVAESPTWSEDAANDASEKSCQSNCFAKECVQKWIQHAVDHDDEAE